MSFSGLDSKACPCFQPCEIVCLECDRSHLYAEVVQIVEERQLCWVRPLLLVTGSATAEVEPSHQDLRGGADLLLPAVLFRSTLDTEMAPLLSYLYSPLPQSQFKRPEGVVQQRLSQLVRQVCQSRPDAFRG